MSRVYRESNGVTDRDQAHNHCIDNSHVADRIKGGEEEHESQHEHKSSHLLENEK